MVNSAIEGAVTHSTRIAMTGAIPQEFTNRSEYIESTVLSFLEAAGITKGITVSMKVYKGFRSAYIPKLVTQLDQGLTESEIADLMLALDRVSQPFNLESNGKTTVTTIIGVGTDGSAPDSYEVAWQRCHGTGSISNNTNFGAQGSEVSANAIPENMIVTTSQVLIVTEVAYKFEPLLGFVDLSDQISYSSFFRPRPGSLESVVADGTSPAIC